MAKMAQSVSNETQTQNVDLSSILARLDAAEAKNRELEAKFNPENKFEKSKEKYKGPWNYSYKLWGEVPVLSYKSVKGDITKDFTYKNHLGMLVNNQFVVLTLANGEEVKVDALEFANNFTRSAKVPCVPLKNGNPFEEDDQGRKADSYQFTDPTYGEFIVPSNYIN